MSDRIFEPETPNRFGRSDPERAGELSIRRTDQAAASTNRFRKFDDSDDEITGLYEPPEDQVSSFGAFRRSAARGVVPAAAGLAVAGPAAEAGAAAGGLVAGPVGGLVGGLVGGAGGAILGGMAGETAQRWALSKLPDSWTDALGMSDRQEKLDQEQAPKASFLGGLAPYAITMRPGGFTRKALPENSTALERIMAHPATARVFGAGVMGGMELGQEAVQGEQPDWTKVAISTGFGLVFNKPTRIGEAITEIGARPVRRAFGLPEPAPAASPLGTEEAAPAPAPEAAPSAAPTAPAGIAPTLFHAPPARTEPTIADAADLGVMGPGHTESTFQGAQEPDPVAVEAARETKRTEQSVIGPDPPPPDVHSVARQMHFDLFTEYDALRDRRRALEAEPGAADHLAATEARLAELEKEVQAANRRAAEATGQSIHEAPVEAPPIVPDIEAQKATIAADVSQQLRAAGRPLDEAEAAGKLIAAHYAARAGAFKGALGTPEELYRREGAEIRSEQIRRKVRTPAAARALDDFQQRMAAGKEQAQRRRNEGSSSVRVMTTAEKYAGVTEEEFNAAQKEAEAAAPELKTLLTDDDWKFMASPEFHQRRTAPPGPNLFTEREAEGQTNIPGTERISEAELAKRRAAEPMKPGVAQKPMDIGLFSDEAKQRELFQREAAPPFYSAVARTIESAKQAKASPDQWLATIRNSPGIKPEELEWLGLEDWLKSQKGPVTKDQIAEYVRANQIEVREVTKGGDDGMAEYQAAIGAMRPDLDEMLRRNDQLGFDTMGQARNAIASENPAQWDFETPADLALAQRYHDLAANRRNTRSGRTKFETYVLPGGENYRELLLTLPPKGMEARGFGPEKRAELNRLNDIATLMRTPEEKARFDELHAELATLRSQARDEQFSSTHFDEPNILAHIRFDDRTIDGKKTLHIAEIQSDWHQKGRKYGYKDNEPLTTRKAEDSRFGENVHEAVNSQGVVVGRGFSPEGALQAAKGMPSVPEAPFKTTWPELSLKRIIRYAAEHGYEQISWDTGATQAARYDLSKQVKAINVTKESNGTFTLDATDNTGRPVSLGEAVKPEAMADIVGKELAEKIAAQTEDQKSYSGLDLKVGGEGMKGFYDEILPAAVNKLTKKFGTRVGKSEVIADTREGMRGELNRMIEEAGGEPTEPKTEAPVPVHTLPITDKLRDAAVEQGFPLFQGARGGIRLNPRGVPGRDYLGVEGTRPIMRLMKDANASTFIHETGHQFLGELMRDAEHELAPDRIKTDAAATLKWLGVNSAEDIETKHHEKFARGFEQYLREGHAPSPELASVFARFKQWLMNIYQTIKGLGKEISPDIRAVFDRMLTTESQRTVIAPERPLSRSLADIHEADAAFYADHEMEGVGDRIAAEADRAYGESPHAASAETKAAATEAVEPAREARPGEPQGGEVHPNGGVAEPDAGRGGPGAVDETERAGGAEGVPEGVGLRGTEAEAGRERPESVPLAGRPAPDLTIAGQSFNVGKDGNVRAENITSAPQFIAAINESSERIPGGGPLTMGEMQGLADDLALDPKTLDEGKLASLFGGIQNLSSKIYALRQTIKAQSETVFNAMRAVQETGTDQATMAFALEAGRLDMMMSVLSSVTTEVGRGLGMSFRNLEGWQKAADLNEFLKANTGKTLFQLKMTAKLGAQLDSPAKVAKYLRDAGKRSFGGMILEYWINGLISGIATHSTYAVGNTILTIEKMGPETAAAAMIGAARKAMGRQGETVRLGEVGAHFAGALRNLPAALQAGIEGARTGMTTLLPGEAARPLIPFSGDTSLVTARTIGNEPVSWGEVGADLFGLVRGMRDGIVSTAALVKAGGQAGAPLFGLSYSPLGQIPDIAYRGVPVVPVGSTIRLPGRFIAAIHSFFRTTNYSIYKSGGAYRTATSEGLNGTSFDARVADIHQNPPETMMEAWRNEATETALMGHVGKFGQALSNLTNVEFNLPVLGGVRLLKFIDPFVHISSNVLKQTVMLRTPAGLLSSEIRADLSGANGTIAQDTAMARMLVGSALSITFGGLAAEGFITGSGPSDPHEAAMWREVYQPHSVRIGDMWYQVNRLGPMGMLLGIAADLYEVAHDATEGDVLKAAAHLQHALTQNILDESFMRGPADLIKAVEDPGRYGEGYIKNFASSFVPFSVGMAQMARAADPYSRQARDVMDAIRAKVPGYSQTLLPRRNIWGEEIPNLHALGGRAISALYEQKVNSDPVNQAMLDLGIHPAAVERKIRNVELTDQQYDDFSRIAGRLAKSRLDVIVQSPDWQRWPKHVRHDVISEVIRQSREGARGTMMQKFPSIPRDATDAKMKKARGE